MTLSGLHRKFLRYCEVERRLAPQTVIAYRSDFLQFLEFLGRQFRWGLVSQDTLATFSTENIRVNQYHMAQQGWSTATIHRRLVYDALVAYLDERPLAKPEDPLFVTAYGRRIAAKVVIRAVRRASQRLGQRVHPHMFRHSYATELLERGADIRDIRDLLGHESVATSEIYTHVSAARKRRVVSLLDRPQLEAVAPPEGHVTSCSRK